MYRYMNYPHQPLKWCAVGGGVMRGARSNVWRVTTFINVHVFNSKKLNPAYICIWVLYKRYRHLRSHITAWLS